MTAPNFIRLPEVKRQTGLSTSEIYRRMDRKEFPIQVKISHKVVVWIQSQVDDWKYAQLPDDLRELLG